MLKAYNQIIPLGNTVKKEVYVRTLMNEKSNRMAINYYAHLHLRRGAKALESFIRYTCCCCGLI